MVLLPPQKAISGLGPLLTTSYKYYFRLNLAPWVRRYRLSTAYNAKVGLDQTSSDHNTILDGGGHGKQAALGNSIRLGCR